MGTEIQPKTYFPGYNLMLDLNNNAGNGMWALYYEDKTLNNRQHYDSFLTRQTTDGFFGYEKEQVRQTILKHESIFRHQLQELHRIYRRQRELMNEFRSRELHKSLVLAETSKSSLFVSQASSEEAKKAWHASNFPLVDSTFDRPTTSEIDIAQSPFCATKGKSRCSPFERRTFDLELPADAYINNEGKEQEERVCGPLVLSDKDVSLSHGSQLNSECDGNASRSNGYLKRTYNLADLNEPILIEETSVSASVNDLCNIACLEEDIQTQNAFAKPNSGVQFLSKEFSQSSPVVRGGGILPNNRHSGSERNEKEQLTYSFKAGKTKSDDHDCISGIGSAHSSMLFKPLQVEPKKTYEPSTFSLSNQSKTDPGRKRRIFGVEISEGYHNRSVDASNTPILDPLNPQPDAINYDSPSLSPWTKPSSTSVSALQDSPCSFDPSSVSPNSMVQFPEFLGGKRHVNGNSRSVPSSREEVLKGSDCVDLKSADGQKKHENPVRGLPWLTGKPHCSGEQTNEKENFYQMSLDSLQNYSSQFFNKAETTKGPTRTFSPSPTCVHESDRRKVENGGCWSSKSLFGFPIVDMAHMPEALISQSSPSESSHHAPKSNGDYTRTDLAHDPESENQLKVKDLVVENGGLNNYISGLRHQVDLNLALNEEETPSVPPLPNAILKIATTEIDLEAPAILESETDVSPEANSLENQLKIPSELSLEESSDSREEFDRVAAEALIAISSSVVQMNTDAACQPVEDSPNDFLLWFADIVSHDGSPRESKLEQLLMAMDDACEHDEESIPEGMDYFEFMTLKLKQESNEEVYRFEPQKDGETMVAASLPKRPRRGQARRGRQRKDFQRDVLPGLVSLSRHEVTEDLQTIEDIFTASGFTWQSSLSRRNAAKKGKRRAASRVCTATAPTQPQQPVFRELGLEESSLTGWGKRTRRLPRQRCPTINHARALKCQP